MWLLTDDPVRWLGWSGREAPRAKRALRIFGGISMPSSLIPCCSLEASATVCLLPAARCHCHKARFARKPAVGGALRRFAAHGPLLGRGTLRAQGMCLYRVSTSKSFVQVGWQAARCSLLTDELQQKKRDDVVFGRVFTTAFCYARAGARAHNLRYRARAYMWYIDIDDIAYSGNADDRRHSTTQHDRLSGVRGPTDRRYRYRYSRQKAKGRGRGVPACDARCATASVLAGARAKLCMCFCCSTTTYVVRCVVPCSRADNIYNICMCALPLQCRKFKVYILF
jgi:hypothetical protein